jgi:hypothetical protein
MSNFDDMCRAMDIADCHRQCVICDATVGIEYHGDCGDCTNTVVIRRNGMYLCGRGCLSTFTRLQAAERYGALVNARTRAEALDQRQRVAALAKPAARAWKVAAREWRRGRSGY